MLFSAGPAPFARCTHVHRAKGCRCPKVAGSRLRRCELSAEVPGSTVRPARCRRHPAVLSAPCGGFAICQSPSPGLSGINGIATRLASPRLFSACQRDYVTSSRHLPSPDRLPVISPIFFEICGITSLRPVTPASRQAPCNRRPAKRLMLCILSESPKTLNRASSFRIRPFRQAAPAATVVYPVRIAEEKGFEPLIPF